MSEERACHSVELTGGTQEIHILPAGRFSGRDGRGPYLLGDPAGVIRATQARGMDLLIDYDHATDYAAPGTRVPAAGWVKNLSVREDGIWGTAEWTETAAAAVKGREYRYLSPVFDYTSRTPAKSPVWCAPRSPTIRTCTCARSTGRERAARPT